MKRLLLIFAFLLSAALCRAGDTVMTHTNTGALLGPSNFFSANGVVTNINLLNVSNIAGVVSLAISNEMLRLDGVTRTNLSISSNWGNHATNHYMKGTGSWSLVYLDANSNAVIVPLGGGGTYLRSAGGAAVPYWSALSATATNVGMSDITNVVPSTYVIIGGGTGLTSMLITSFISNYVTAVSSNNVILIDGTKFMQADLYMGSNTTQHRIIGLLGVGYYTNDNTVLYIDMANKNLVDANGAWKMNNTNIADQTWVAAQIFSYLNNGYLTLKGGSDDVEGIWFCNKTTTNKQWSLISSDNVRSIYFTADPTGTPEADYDNRIFEITPTGVNVISNLFSVGGTNIMPWIQSINGSQAVTRAMASGLTTTQQTHGTWIQAVDDSQAVTRVMASGLTTTQQNHAIHISGLTTTQQNHAAWISAVDGSQAVTRVMASGLTTTQQNHAVQLSGLTTTQQNHAAWISAVDISQAVTRVMASGLTTTQENHAVQLSGLTITQQNHAVWISAVDGSQAVTRAMASGLTTTQENHAIQISGLTTTQNVIWTGKVDHAGGSIAYLDVTAPASLAGAPASGFVRLAGQTVNNQESLSYIQSDGSAYRLGRDLVHTVFSDDSIFLSNGVAVYWTPTNTTTAHHVKRALATDLGTMPCQGVVVGGGTNFGGSCTVMWMGRTPTGYLSAVNAALPYGTPLYVSKDVAGDLSSVAPAAPYIRQLVGYVSYNGAMDLRLGQALLPEASAVFVTLQLWSASNSVITNVARAMRPLSYGNAGVGVWTNVIPSNNHYTAYCSGPAGLGLTILKAGLYQVNVTMRRTTGGGDALSMSAELYVRATNGVETEITPVAGTAAQSIGGTDLEYIFSLNITNNTVINSTDSLMLKFKSSARAGSPSILIGQGYVNVPVPSGQFALESDYSNHVATTIALGAHGGDAIYVRTNETDAINLAGGVNLAADVTTSSTNIDLATGVAPLGRVNAMVFGVPTNGTIEFTDGSVQTTRGLATNEAAAMDTLVVASILGRYDSQLSYLWANSAIMGLQLAYHMNLSQTPAIYGRGVTLSDFGGIDSNRSSGFVWDAGGKYLANYNSDAVTIASPKAHFKMNDDAANSTITDSVGAYPGIYTNGANSFTSEGSTNGKLNKAICTDDTGAFYYVPSLNVDMDNYVSFSLCAWVNYNHTGKGVAAGWFYFNQYWIGTPSAGGGNISFAVANEVTSPLEYNNGAWHHVAGTYDGEKHLLYVDGSLVATSTATGVIDVHQNAFGSTALSSNLTEDTSFRWKGAVDDVRVYSNALTAAEVAAIYNAGSGNENSAITNSGTTSNMVIYSTTNLYPVRFSNLAGEFLVVSNVAGDITNNVDWVLQETMDGGGTWDTVPMMLATGSAQVAIGLTNITPMIQTSNRAFTVAGSTNLWRLIVTNKVIRFYGKNGGFY